MEHLAFKWSPDVWKKKGLQHEGCFGFVDGHLVLGHKHHQLIMAAFLNKGWTWAQLAAAKQAWGWFSIQEPYDYGGGSWTNQHPQQEKSKSEAKKWPWINILFSSDAGMQRDEAVKGAKQAFQYLYQLPVHQPYDATGVQDEQQLGKGLKGVDHINNYLQGGSSKSYADAIQGVPPPPEDENSWSEAKEQRFDQLRQQQAAGDMSQADQDEYLKLWIARSSVNEPPKKPEPTPQDVPTQKGKPDPNKFTPSQLPLGQYPVGSHFMTTAPQHNSYYPDDTWEVTGPPGQDGQVPHTHITGIQGNSDQNWIPGWIAQPQVTASWREFTPKLASGTYKFVWADGIFEVTKGFLKAVHHWNMMEPIVSKLGHPPNAYVAGDYTESPFHPGVGNVTIRWHEGTGVPSPVELGNMMQQYLRTQPVTAKIELSSFS